MTTGITTKNHPHYNNGAEKYIVPEMVRTWCLEQGIEEERIASAWDALPEEVKRGRIDYLPVLAMMVEIIQGAAASDAIKEFMAKAATVTPIKRTSVQDENLSA